MADSLRAPEQARNPGKDSPGNHDFHQYCNCRHQLTKQLTVRMPAQARDPGKDMPLGIVSATSICTLLYIIMCIVICMMVPYADIDINAPFSSAFGYVGLTWAKCAPSPSDFSQEDILRGVCQHL